MIQKNIGIINYGVGNHSSVINTVKSLGHLVTLSSKINELDKCEILLLPGVGSFSVAMNGLEKFALINFIKNWAKEKKTNYWYLSWDAGHGYNWYRRRYL